MSYFSDGFTDSVAVYVPSTWGVNKPLSSEVHKLFMELSVKALSERFGGATATPGYGGWVSREGLVMEPVWIVRAYTKSLTDSDLDFLYKHAEELKNRLQQEAVSVEVNGELNFV